MGSMGLFPLLYSHVEWGDYDADGDLDIALMGSVNFNFLTSYSRIYRNNGGSFSTKTVINPALGRGALDWGDFDNDGDIDLAIAGLRGNSRQTRIYRNDNGNFILHANFNATRYASLDWGDYDNDGDLDLVVVGLDGSNIYENQNNVFAPINAGLPSSASNTKCSIQWGDFDNDGDLDLLFQRNRIYLYENAAGSLVLYSDFSSSNSGEAKWGDIDNDGDLDIVQVGSAIRVYKNDSANFNLFATLGGGADGSCDLGDYDNDGDLDILATGSYNTRIFRNDIDSFVTISTSLENLRYSSGAWGDYDNDGDLDIVISGNTTSGRITKVYRNDNITANQAPGAPTGLQSSILNDSICFTWQAATDDSTPASALTYNLRFQFLGDNFNSWNSDTSSGHRYVPDYGNVGLNTSYKFPLEELISKVDPFCVDTFMGELIWHVQTIDNGFAGSVFNSDTLFIEEIINPEQEFSAYNDTAVCNGDSILLNAEINLIHSANFNQNSDAYIRFDAIAPLVSASPRTVSFWLKSNTVASSQHIFGINSVSNAPVFLLGIAPNNKLEIDDGQLKYSNSEIADSSWHHIAYSFDGAIIKLYIDGQLDATFASNSFLSQSDRFTIGRALNSTVNQRYNGKIAEFTMWNSTMNDSEIDFLYRSSPSSGFSKYMNLLVYYPFTKVCSEDSLLDYSGNGINGHINNKLHIDDFDTLEGYDNSHTWTIRWESQNDGHIANSNSAWFNPNLSGKQYFRADFGKMHIKDTFELSLNSLPQITTLNDSSFCEGDSLFMYAGNFDSYYWSTGDTSSGIYISNQGLYTITVTDSNSCSKSHSVLINKNNLPNPDLGRDTALCMGDVINLNAGLFSEYNWSTGDTIASINVSTQGQYAIEVLDSNYCRAFDSINIFVNPLPNPYLGEDTALCQGDSILLFPGFFDTYSWNTGQTNMSVFAFNPANYSVSVTDSNNCTNSDTILITGLSLNPPNLGNDTLICPNDSLVLNPGLYNTYIWNTGDSSASIVVNNSGNYSVLVLDSNTCKAYDSIYVDWHNAPQPQLGSDTSICSGDSIILDPGNFTNYFWSTGSNSSTILISNAGIYGITVRDSNSCIGSDSIILDVNPLPQVSLIDADTICLGDQYLISPQVIGNGPFTYYWQDSSNNNVQIINSTQLGTGNFSYSVKVFDQNQCSASDSSLIVIETCTSLKTQKEKLNIKVFPNPVKDILNVENLNGDELLIEVLNLKGDVLLTQRDISRRIQIDLNNLFSGVYFLRMSSGNNITHLKILKK